MLVHLHSVVIALQGRYLYIVTLSICRTYLVLKLVYVELLFYDEGSQVVAVVPNLDELIP